jgi:AcrR family transcriptional regulator
VASRSYSSQLRAQQAEMTRRSIIEAARKLFAEQGYARTSLAAVAAEAGVAPNTVYASVGGKSALVLAMTRDGDEDPAVAETMGYIAESEDPRDILRATGAGTGQVRRRQQATLSVLLDSRNADPAIAAALAHVAESIQAYFAIIADRLIGLGSIRPGLSKRQVEQMLWFYFGFEAWRTVREMGWDWDEAAEWLAVRAAGALLPPE